MFDPWRRHHFSASDFGDEWCNAVRPLSCVDVLESVPVSQFYFDFEIVHTLGGDH